jgi:hypothetical protein
VHRPSWQHNEPCLVVHFLVLTAAQASIYV